MQYPTSGVKPGREYREHDYSYKKFATPTVNLVSARWLYAARSGRAEQRYVTIRGVRVRRVHCLTCVAHVYSRMPHRLLTACINTGPDMATRAAHPITPTGVRM